MNRLWVVLFAILLLASLARAVEDNGTPGRTEISITVFKGRHELWLFHGQDRIAVYRVFLGSSPEGDKRKRGDNKTPQGYYQVVEKRANSKFHRFLLINYPNRKDADRAYDTGMITADEWADFVEASETGSRPRWDTPLGGYLGIHGIGENEEFKLGLIGDMDWTDGCIAVTNQDIEDLFERVPLGTVVRIRE